MNDVIQWTATVSGVVAAIMVALNISARITGIGFAVFIVSSLAWISFGFMEDDNGLALQNVVLTVVNIVGVYRYLIAPNRKANAEAGTR